MKPGDDRGVAPTSAVVDAGMDRWDSVGDRLRSLDPDFFREVLHRIEVCVAAREACRDCLKPLILRASL
jgi:hypothetical protein